MPDDGTKPRPGTTHETDDGRHSRWADPASPSRFAVLVAVWIVLGVLPMGTNLNTGNAVGWGLTATGFWICIEWHVERQARRDLTEDLAQQLWDGRIHPADLRRARGYWQVERAIERADWHEYRPRSPAQIVAQYERFESALAETDDSTLSGTASGLANAHAQETLAWVLGLRDECDLLGDAESGTGPELESESERHGQTKTGP